MHFSVAPGNSDPVFSVKPPFRNDHSLSFAQVKLRNVQV